MSCDNSFDAKRPVSFKNEASKIEGLCKKNTDCVINREVCDFVKGKCVSNPCYEVNCSNKGSCEINRDKKDENGNFLKYCDCDKNYFDDNDGHCLNPCENENCDGHGECKVLGDDSVYCDCEDGYQNNGENKTECKISCSNELVNNCGNNGSCNDSTGEVVCSCNLNYFQDTTGYNCINPCDSYDRCKENEHCEAKGLGFNDVSCVCDDNYRKDGESVCVYICAGVECGINEECKIENSEGDDVAICVCKDGYKLIHEGTEFQKCIKSCESNDCQNSSGEVKGVCDDSGFLEDRVTRTDKKYCKCQKDDNPEDENYIVNYFEEKIDDNDDENDDIYHLECNSPCENLEGCNEKLDSTLTLCSETEEETCEYNELCFWDYNQKKCFGKNIEVSAVPRGKCIAENLMDKYCICDEGYQDVNHDLSCNISCDNPGFTCDENQICSWTDGREGRLLGLNTCVCKEGYNLNDFGECVWQGYAWTRHIKVKDTGDDIVRNLLVIDSNNNIYTAGAFRNRVDFNTGYGKDKHVSNDRKNIFINKIDNHGRYLWTKSIGNIHDEKLGAIAVDYDNNLYISGEIYGIVDFDFTDGVDNKGIIGGNGTGGGKLSKFISKINADGSYGWTKIYYNENYFIEIDSLAGDLNRNIYVLGRDNNIFIEKLDENGNLINNWKVYITGKKGNVVTTDDNGNIYVTGLLDNDKLFITKISPDGNILWEKKITTGGYSSGNAIAVDNDYVYITGGFQGTVDFDSGVNTDEHTATGLSDIFITKLAVNGDYLWTKTFGGEGHDGSRSLELDGENIYITGYFKETVDFDFEMTSTDEYTSRGGKDIFITRISKTGNYIWTKVIGGADNEETYSVKVDKQNNLFLTGRFQNTVDFNPNVRSDGSAIDNYTASSGAGRNYYDYFIWKYIQNEPDCSDVNCGEHGSCVTDSDNMVSCECETGFQDNNNSLFCKPSCEGVNDCGEHGNCNDSSGDIVCKCDIGFELNGNFQCSNEVITDNYNWTQTIGGTRKEESNSITVDSHNNIYITGKFQGVIDFNFTDDNNPYTDFDFDEYYSGGQNKNALFITKLNNNGSYGWTRVIKGGDSLEGISVKTDSNDDVVITGVYSGIVDFNFGESVDLHTSEISPVFQTYTNDIFTTKISKNGEYLWTNTVGGNHTEEAKGIFIDENDDIYIVGSFQTINTGEEETKIDFDPGDSTDEYASGHASSGFISKYNGNGEYLWTRVIKGTSSNKVNSITGRNGSIFITGSYKGTVNFNFNNATDQRTSNGKEDIFITKLNSEGEYFWTKTFGGTDSDSGNAIFTDDDGYVYIAGSFIYTVDFDFTDGVNEKTSIKRDAFITKIYENGEYKWTKTINASSDVDINSLVAGDFNIYVTGYFIESLNYSPMISSNGEQDIFIAKINKDSSDYVWLEGFGGIGTDIGTSLALDSFNNIYATGFFKEIVDFSTSDIPDIHTSSEYFSDIFVWKFTSNSCRNISCTENEICSTNSDTGVSGCICKEGFHLNGNYNCIED